MAHKNESLQFQNIVDMWTKQNILKMKQRVKIALMKGQRLKTKISDHNWKEDASRVQDSLYVNVALSNGAPDQMSYENLVQIGKLWLKADKKTELKKILDCQIINCNDQFYNLADPAAQKHIAKSFRTSSYKSPNDHPDLEIIDNEPRLQRVINNKKIA